MSVNFEYYKTFYYVAKYQNITRAAEVLHLTQPSVTKTIQNLEDQFECRLFIRTKRGVKLTPEGDKLFRQIQPACQSILAAEIELEKVKTLSGGLIRISANDLAVKHILLPTLQKFREENPRVIITIDRMPLADALLALDTGELDLVLDFDGAVRAAQDNIQTEEAGAEPPHSAKVDFERRVLRKVVDVPIVGPYLASLANAELSLRDLFAYPLILPKTDIFSKNYYVTLFKENGFEREIDMEVSGVATRVLLTEKNCGVSFLPPESVENEIRSGTVFPLRTRERLLERQILLMTSKKIPLRLAARSFADRLP